MGAARDRPRTADVVEILPLSEQIGSLINAVQCDTCRLRALRAAKIGFYRLMKDKKEGIEYVAAFNSGSR
jgi:hypothetical protein